MSTDRAPAKLLVVDDLEVNRELLGRRVRRLGHEPGYAANGVEALTMLGAEPWDLVLLDITMPEMDGYEVLRRLRADPALTDIPVVMVTAIDETDSVVRCLELGADDYLTKPFNATVLQARIESSLNKKRLADQKRATLRALARELEIGRRIQQGFLPETLPALAGWELAATCTPARQVGGDFYDAMMLPGGRLTIAVADVCDKGVGAALYMALFRSLLRALLAQSAADEHPADALARCVGFVNDYIATEHGRDNMFATMFVAVLDPAAGAMVYLNAGHDAPMLARAAGGELERLAPGGPAVGLMAGVGHAVAQVTLAPGDRLLVYTDGVTDAVGEAVAVGATAAFGEAAVARRLVTHEGSARALLDLLAADVAAHVGERPAHDDITMLCVARSG